MLCRVGGGHPPRPSPAPFASGDRRQRRGDVVQVTERLVRDALLVEPHGQAPPCEPPLRRERHAAVGDPVSDVDERTEAGDRAALAALAAHVAERPVAERRAPARRVRGDVVRDDSSPDALALEDRVDQLVEACRDDQRVVLLDELLEARTDTDVLEQVGHDLRERRGDGGDLPRDHLVQRQPPSELVLERPEQLWITKAIVDHVKRVDLRDGAVPVQDERQGRLVLTRHKRYQPAGSDQPPSITTTWPRIISASGEERNETTPAMSSGVTSRPAGFAAPEREHLLAVREVLERTGLDDPGRDRVDADATRRELDREVPDERLERGLRDADERVVLEDADRAEARDARRSRSPAPSRAPRCVSGRGAHARWR